MEDRAVADYFVIAGLSANPQLSDENSEGLSPNHRNIQPITDIAVIFPSLGEEVPAGWECVERTPEGYPANLNSGSIRSPEVYVCFRRGGDKPPLVDIGVMYDGKERLLPDAQVVLSTPEGRPANVNNTSARILLTFRRAPETMPCNELVVTDVCVIITNKGERPPHAFCLIPKNLNRGAIMGCDVFLCYKKSTYHPPLISYKPEVLFRYPPIDRNGFPFPASVAMFCLPMCATVECWPKRASQPKPVFSTFILTVADATEKIYGSAVTFYEEFDDSLLSVEEKERLGYDPKDWTLNVNKSISLLSHYPFFDSFRTFLSFLVKLSGSTAGVTVPIERYISHLLEEVPFPSIQRPHILMQLNSTQSVLMSHPHDSPRLKNGASFRLLLSNLGPENAQLVLLLMLMEGKILIHSLRPDVLTAVAEAISVLIFPFHWQCPYIPLCPLALSDVLQAPVPFLIGVDSRLFDLYEPPVDVTCVDLDTNTVTVSEDKRSLLTAKLLPKKPARALKHSLEVLVEKSNQMGRGGRVRMDMDIDFQVKKRETSLELEIQEAFLRFMTSILKGYRSFLHPIMKAPTIGATDASSLFDFQGFLRTRDRTHHKFYQQMLRTQMFFRFIEERSFVSDMDSGLAFFDECMDKLDADPDSSILIDTASKSERTVFVLPPDTTGLPPGPFHYNSKFVLNEGLFKFKLKQTFPNEVTPGSPVARRTKQEIKSAIRSAKLHADQPRNWAKYLMSTCYSLWFIHLPSYTTMASSKHMALCLAFEMLVRMSKNRLLPADEVCYRVVMQLCGLYSQPVVAVKVLFEMKRHGVTPNAITYGFYNKAVLEAQWPSNVSNSSQLLWNKLRNAIAGVAQFRAAGKRAHHSADRLSTGSGEALAAIIDGPQRVSSSSDVGYGSMFEEGRSSGVLVGNSQGTKVENPNTVENPTTASNENAEDSANPTTSENAGNPTSTATTPHQKFWGKMGQSFDSWVKTVATLAAESSPSTLSLSYKGETLSRTATDSAESTSPRAKRKLDFSPDPGMRMLRSVSFGNDTQIMSKLKEMQSSPQSGEDEEKGLASPETSRGQPKSPERRQITPVEEEASPTRVPVTHNDPLGAFTPQRASLTTPQHKFETPEAPPKRTSSEGCIGVPNGGLRPGLAFHRSSTLPNYASSGGGETSPGGDEPPTAMTGFSSFGSGLKAFSRYSPARISLRKAGTQLIESTIGGKKAEALLDQFNQLKSVATIQAKKKLDEFKVAIQSPSITNGPFGRPFDEEITEDPPETLDQWSAVSESYLDELLLTTGVADNASADGGGFSGIEVPSQFDTPLSASTQSLAMDHLTRPGPGHPTAVEISMTTCSVCHNCSSLVFDEEIMAGWTAEDSNLNTKCPHCTKWTVPFLQASVRDFRSSPCPLPLGASASSLLEDRRRASTCGLSTGQNPRNSAELSSEIDKLKISEHVDPLGVMRSVATIAEDGTSGATSESGISTSSEIPISSTAPAEAPAYFSSAPITVPYLSPLVLRKELENVLEHEGDGCLTEAKFVDEHPIIYWNMVWFFHRSNLTSHLRGLVLNAETTKPIQPEQPEGGDQLPEISIHPTWSTADHRHVSVRCKWEDGKNYGDFGRPLWVQWVESQQNTGTEKSDIDKLIADILKAVNRNDVSSVCPKLLYHYHKEGRKRHYPTYRDILFLSIVAGGKEITEFYAFDRDYRNAYSRLRNSDEYEGMDLGDEPPLDAALFCRKFFKELEF